MNWSDIPVDSTMGRALRLPLRLLPRWLVLPVLQGALRGALWITGSSNHGCWLGSYELEKQREFARRVRPGTVVYDIGANVGFYTLLASRLLGPSGRVVAFEPLPENLAFLERHVALNRVANASIVRAAVGEAPGRALFQSGAGRCIGHLDEGGDLPVRLVALDGFVEAGEAPPPDLIKMDIEGGELAALRGAGKILRSSRPVIFLATHGAELHRECCRLLESLDYELRPLGGRSVEDTDELLAVPRTGDPPAPGVRPA